MVTRSGISRGRHLLFRALSWIGRHELGTLVVLALVAGGLWVFAELADEVVEGETHRFDTAVLLALRSADDPSDPIGPPWVQEMVRDFTALGGNAVLTFLVLAVTGLMLLYRKRRATLLMLGAVIGGAVASTLLKRGFDRPRPDLVPHDSYVTSASFPSGHSMLSAVVYLTLAVMLASVQPRWSMRAYLLIVAVLLVVAIGASRVYVGVHWPTDVMAGWAAGTVWALLAWLVARWLQRRGEVEGG